MKKHIRFWVGILAAALIISTLVLPGCSSASSPAAVPAATSPALAAAVVTSSAPADSPAAKGPGQEGITVHGHWTIEVINPDGSLAERREFENALNGDNILTALLSRNNSMGPWAIILVAATIDQNAFQTVSGASTYGSIVENTYPETPETAPFIFETLIVSQTSSPNTVVLSGTATAQRNGSIKDVGTQVWLLNKSLPPSNDYTALGLGNSSFTATTLADAVNLTTGQQVAVTVVISFS
jgi:hypothetical protein